MLFLLMIINIFQSIQVHFRSSARSFCSYCPQDHSRGPGCRFQHNPCSFQCKASKIGDTAWQSKTCDTCWGPSSCKSWGLRCRGCRSSLQIKFILKTCLTDKKEDCLPVGPQVPQVLLHCQAPAQPQALGSDAKPSQTASVP